MVGFLYHYLSFENMVGFLITSNNLDTIRQLPRCFEVRGILRTVLNILHPVLSLKEYVFLTPISDKDGHNNTGNSNQVSTLKLMAI